MKRKFILVFLILIVAFIVFYLFGQRFRKTAIFQPKASQNNSTSGDNSADNSPAALAPDIQVDPSDCDKGCDKYKDENELKYCQEICGLAVSENADNGEELSDCSSKSGVQKDYCLKDMATSKNNFGACDDIKNPAIQKACKDRITQDILEQNKTEETSGY